MKWYTAVERLMQLARGLEGGRGLENFNFLDAKEAGILTNLSKSELEEQSKQLIAEGCISAQFLFESGSCSR